VPANAIESPESELFGAPIQTIPEQVRAANPISYLTSGRQVPPFLIAHGDRDCVVPLQQSAALHQALETFGGPERVRLEIVEGSGHWREFDAAGQVPVALDFLEETFAAV
jgi:dipeptidyl aminopeptidase/acylaminoacyl peptidase